MITLDVLKDLINSSYVALMGVIAWLIITQIKTNKNVQEVLTEFRIAIQIMKERDENQASLYQSYREEIKEHKKKLDTIQSDLTTIRQKEYDRSNR